jgi:N-acetylmuramoyl-L-alanine amidase
MPLRGRALIAAAVVGLAVLVDPASAFAGAAKSVGPLAQNVAPPPATTVVEKRAARDGQRAEAKGGVSADRAELVGGEASTTFLLDLSAGVQAEVFTLADPYRVVIDLPDVVFHLPKGTGQGAKGLVSAFRYGLLAEGKARIVMDTTKPVLIAKAGMTNTKGQAVRLSVELTPTTAAAFGGGTGGERTAQAPPLKPEIYEDRSEKPKNRAKPVILIDPGHGGIDPGAMAADGLSEKTVVLAVAQRLKERLSQGGRYDVYMTRARDIFISLDGRLRRSKTLAADLFISLHADSIAQNADSVRGATVYTLSERASDEEARLMAEKENNSDAIAGLTTAKFEEQGQVRSILIDLLKRETANFSADFSNTLVKKMTKTVSLSRDPQRSAAFKVLRQADTPSVLIELGYMSHAEDEKLLNSPAWQDRVATSIATAADAYFGKRTAGAR